MYRRRLKEKEKMEAEEGQLQFLSRVGQLPMVTSTMDQLGSLYSRTKESNRLMKFTLQTAESGVKVVTCSAMPVINKFEKPIGAIDNMACTQLEKLEEKYPIITKPTEEVVKETKELYNSTLKPTVDRITSVTQYGIDGCKTVTQYGVDGYKTVTQYGVDGYKTVTQYGVDGIKSITQYGVDGLKTVTQYGVDGYKTVTQYGVDGYKTVTQYGVDKYNGAKNYGTEKVAEMKTYTYDTLEGVKEYGVSKATDAASTSLGKAALGTVDSFLDVTENLLDEYLPPGSEEPVEKPGSAPKEEQTTLTHATRVTNKVRRRVVTRALGELQNAQVRSKESLEKLGFTVDLIQYAKVNIDGLQNKLSSMPAKVRDIWTEINKTEEEAEQENIVTEKTDLQKEGLERRLIITARHMTQKLKRSLGALSAGSIMLPAIIRGPVDEALNLSKDLYHMFSNTEGKFDGVSTMMLEQTRSYISSMQDILNNVGSYLVGASPLNWLGSTGRSNLEEDCEEELEMEDVLNEGRPKDESLKKDLNAGNQDESGTTVDSLD